MTAPVRASLRQIPERIAEIRESIAGLRALGELSSYVSGALHRVDVNLAACLYSARDAIARAEDEAAAQEKLVETLRGEEVRRATEKVEELVAHLEARSRPSPEPPTIPATVRDIVAERLRAGGYAGLCNPPAECGCGIADLMACGQPGEDCTPADSEPCDGHCAWGCDAGEPHYIERKTKS